MKIGILTYHRAHNYGALLQAYALKTYIMKFGHDVEIIDYWPDYHANDYELIPYFKSRSLLSKIKSILFLCFGYFRIVKRANGYKRFIREQFNLSDTPLYTTENELNKAVFDVAIYGSDQIWRRSHNPLFNGFSDVYWGAYPENATRKFTYAVSMGNVDVNNQDMDYLRKMLTNFNSISVREEGLKNFVEDIVGHQVPLVLDPVFLLEKNEWLTIESTSIRTIHEKYIFFYQLNASKVAVDFVNHLKHHYGYKVIEIRGRVEPFLFGNRYFQTANPIDFISLIKNAEIVVSTSFHGVAFSVLFEKQFFALGMNNADRVLSLLNKLDIQKRFVIDTNQVDLNEKIDYEKVNLKIAELKHYSRNFIIDALSEKN